MSAPRDPRDLRALEDQLRARMKPIPPEEQCDRCGGTGRVNNGQSCCAWCSSTGRRKPAEMAQQKAAEAQVGRMLAPFEVEPETVFVGRASPLASTEPPPEDDERVRCGVGAPETWQGNGPRPGQTLVLGAGQTLPSPAAQGIEPEPLARWIGERLHSDVVGRHMRDLSDVRAVLTSALVERFGLAEAAVRLAVEASSHELLGGVHISAAALARRLTDLGAGT